MKNNADAIYLITGDNRLERVPRQHYEKEALLQELVEKYPEILAGDQMGGDEPVRLLLVKREAGIPDGEDRGDRWSVDHLLLDQFGVPTLVEVKRSSDTRIRREVVGQLLEYAANVDVYWPSDRIRALAVEQHGGSEGLDQSVLQLLHFDPEADGADSDEIVQNYWAQVEENLKSGRMRLLFVADELPREVRRIIEFLNEKMTGVEVLGVELRQYVGTGLRAMVPRIIGQTEGTKRIKGGGTSPLPRTNREAFLSACDKGLHPFLDQMIGEAERRGLTVYWGRKGFSLRAQDREGGLHSLFYCYPPGAGGYGPAHVEGYLPPMLRETPLGERLSSGLLGIGGFSKGGQFTFRMMLTEETVDSATRALKLVWDVAGELERTVPT